MTHASTSPAAAAALSGDQLLAALGLAPGEPAEALRAVARLAAQICGAPMGAVSLVGSDRQVVVGSVGLTEDSVPLGASYCAVAVQSLGAPLLVADALTDQRFADSALALANPGVRSYAGMPLSALSGDALGTVCALGDEPMALDAARLAMLVELARVTADLLDSRRTAAELAAAYDGLANASREREQQRAQFELVFSAAPTGMTLVGQDGRYLRVNQVFADLVGRTPQDLIGRHVAELSAPEDHQEDVQVLSDLLEAGQGSSLRHKRYLLPDGQPVPALVTTSLVRPEREGPWLLLNQVETVAERQNAESRLLEVQSAVDGIISIDSRGRVLAWNLGAERLLGHPAASMLGKTLDAIIPEGLRGQHESGVGQLRDGGAARLLDSTVEVPALRSDGRLVRVELSLSRWERAGQPCFTAILRDVTERRSAQTRADLLAHAAATANAASSFREAARSVLADLCDRLGWVCGHAWTAHDREATWHVADHPHTSGQPCRLAEVTRAGSAPSLSHLPEDGLTRIARDRAELAGSDLEPHLDRCGIGSAIAVPVRAGGDVVGTLALYLPDGASPPDSALTAACEQVGVLLGRVVERERAAAVLRHQAGHDPLTELANRRTLLEHVADAQQRMADGTLPGSCALVLLDLDRFKVVNDALGHTCGDLLLIEVARRLRTAAGAGHLVARLGGDEFVVLAHGLPARLPGGDDPAGALAARLVEALRGTADIAGQAVPVHASAGACTLSPEHAGAPHYPTMVLRDADIALRQAKRRGRDRVEVFDAALRSDTEARLSDETALEHAVADGSLVLHYQPIIDLRSGLPIGAEALVRWPRAGHGLVPPDRFIPLAEQTGLIVELGRWALHRACHDAAGWHDTAPALRSGTVSVNVSARQLAHPRFPHDVAAALASSGLPAARLVLEITESAFIDDLDGVLRTLEDLRSTGVRLALDDFGTGYSSLSYVQRLPIDVLKVDKSFVDPITGPAQGTALTEVVLKLAQATGMRTVAEGVETPAQAQALRALGCHSAQGWAWSQAVPLAALEAALAADVDCLPVAGRGGGGRTPPPRGGS